MKSRSRIAILVGLGTVAVAALIAVFNFIKARNTPSAASCVLYLHEIDVAKQLWAAENHKAAKDAPTWKDLVLYITHRVIPECVEGGTYTIGRLDEPPKCSIGGPSHELH